MIYITIKFRELRGIATNQKWYKLILAWKSLTIYITKCTNLYRTILTYCIPGKRYTINYQYPCDTIIDKDVFMIIMIKF